MSLNFDLSKIALETRTVIADRDCPNPHYVPGKSDPDREFDYRKGDRIMNPVTNALIWRCMAVGLNGITEDNLVEFAVRCRVVDALHGKPLSTFDADKDTYVERGFTMDELRAHIGIRTNVSTEKRASWLKRMVDGVERDIQYIERRKKEDAAKAAA